MASADDLLGDVRLDANAADGHAHVKPVALDRPQLERRARRHLRQRPARDRSASDRMLARGTVTLTLALVLRHEPCASRHRRRSAIGTAAVRATHTNSTAIGFGISCFSIGLGEEPLERRAAARAVVEREAGSRTCRRTCRCRARSRPRPNCCAYSTAAARCVSACAMLSCSIFDTVASSSRARDRAE